MMGWMQKMIWVFGCLVGWVGGEGLLVVIRLCPAMMFQKNNLLRTSRRTTNDAFWCCSHSIARTRLYTRAEARPTTHNPPPPELAMTKRAVCVCVCAYTWPRSQIGTFTSIFVFASSDACVFREKPADSWSLARSQSVQLSCFTRNTYILLKANEQIFAMKYLQRM